MRPLRSFQFACVVLLAGGASSCDSGGVIELPYGDFNHSVSTFACGPSDAASTAVLLARDPIDGVQPSHPYIRVTIERPAGELGGTTWMVGGVLNGASVVYSPSAGTYEEASSGSIRIDRVVAQERVEGSVSVRFPSRAVTEEFSAPWIEMFILCG